MSRNPEEKGPVGGRREVGNSQSSQLHPPHVTENDAGAPVQAEHPEHQGELAALPANASGTDTQPAEEQPREVRPESAYEGRASQDKDQPPSQSAS